MIAFARGNVRCRKVYEYHRKPRHRLRRRTERRKIKSLGRPFRAVKPHPNPPYPPLRIVLFNTLNLDSPATSKELQNKTHTFLQSLLPDDAVAIPQTVLLTHLPLYRGEGICSDPPKFEYWKLNITDNEGNVTGYFRPIKHQNHLSRWASDWILETIFGDHDEGIILNGHDHEGCDVLHRRLPEEEQSFTHEFVHDELRKREESVMSAGEEVFDEDHASEHEEHPMEISQQAAHVRNNVSDGIWKAEKFTRDRDGIREITVRSMMGDFQGNVGLLTGEYNPKKHRTSHFVSRLI